MLRVIPLWGVVLILQGCEAPLPAVPPPSTTATSDDSWTQWRAIADTAAPERDIEQAALLAATMATTDDGLRPLITYIGDASVPAEKRVLAIICLSNLRDHLAGYESQLRELCAASQPEATRKLATHTLGLLSTPGAMQRMQELLDDSERPVREAALGVLLSFHPERVTDRLQAFWDDPETSAPIRDQVIMGMPPHLVQPYLGLFSDAAVDQELAVIARLKAVSVLGQLGGPEHIAVLKKCIDNDPDETVKDQARGALALLEAGSDLESAGAGQNVPALPPPTASGPPA